MREYAIPIGFGVAVIAGIVFVMSDIGEPSSSSSNAPRDPMSGRSEFNIPVQDERRVAAGEKLYQTSCASCHGADLRGTDKGPSHLAIIYNPIHHTDNAFLTAVKSGVQAHHWKYGNMPATPEVSQADFTNIIAYVRENQRVQGFEAYRR